MKLTVEKYKHCAILLTAIKYIYFQMYRLAVLQWLLQAGLTVSSDLAANTLLSYSTAVEREVWGDRRGPGEAAVGQSQKYEHFLPPPPDFRADSGLDTFGLRETARSSLDSNTAAVVSPLVMMMMMS